MSVRRVLELSLSGTIKRRQVLDPVTDAGRPSSPRRTFGAPLPAGKRLVPVREAAGEVAAVPPVRATPVPLQVSDRPLAHRGRGRGLLGAARQLPARHGRGRAAARARCRRPARRPLPHRPARRGSDSSLDHPQMWCDPDLNLFRGNTPKSLYDCQHRRSGHRLGFALYQRKATREALAIIFQSEQSARLRCSRGRPG